MFKIKKLTLLAVLVLMTVLVAASIFISFEANTSANIANGASSYTSSGTVDAGDLLLNNYETKNSKFNINAVKELYKQLTGTSGTNNTMWNAVENLATADGVGSETFRTKN